MSEKSMLGGFFVTEEIYEYHQREISKLVKERDKAEQQRDVWRGLSICLIGLFVLVVVLQWFEK